MNANFSDNLKKIRKENHLSQEQLADKLGVSRQSVSKWESSQAYPEMDKVLQICKMFNLNIDELLNQDIKEIKENKEQKNKLNKNIDDFLNFITKTIDMFTSMSFKSKLKCIIEQFLIVFILYLLFFIIGFVCSTIIFNLLNVLPWKVYTVIYQMLKSIYLIICCVFVFIIFIHVFKTRYLDYYEFVKEDLEKESNDIESTNETLEENKKIILEKKKEKIVIRDPKHSEYKFINGLFKCCLFMIRCFLMLFFIGFSFIFIGLVFTFVLLVYHISVNTIFIGLSILNISCILINLIVLIGLFCFIFNKKFNAKKYFILFIISIIMGGVGASLSFIQGLNLEYKEYSYENKNELIKEFNYTDDLLIGGYQTAYIFEVNNDLSTTVKVKVNYNEDIHDVHVEEENKQIFIHYNLKYDSFIDVYKLVKKDLKNNIISSYESIIPEYKIITSEKNIKKIISNLSYENYTDLTVEENQYILNVYDRMETDGPFRCYMEDNYYYNCAIVYGEDINEIQPEEFSYSKDGLKYDKNKYICNKDRNKRYYCRLKEEYVEEGN